MDSTTAMLLTFTTQTHGRRRDADAGEDLMRDSKGNIDLAKLPDEYRDSLVHLLIHGASVEEAGATLPTHDVKSYNLCLLAVAEALEPPTSITLDDYEAGAIAEVTGLVEWLKSKGGFVQFPPFGEIDHGTFQMILNSTARADIVCQITSDWVRVWVGRKFVRMSQQRGGR